MLLETILIIFVAILLGLGSAKLSIAFFNKLQEINSLHRQGNLLASYILAFIFGVMSVGLIFLTLFYFFL